VVSQAHGAFRLNPLLDSPDAIPDEENLRILVQRSGVWGSGLKFKVRGEIGFGK